MRGLYRAAASPCGHIDAEETKILQVLHSLARKQEQAAQCKAQQKLIRPR